MHRQSPLLLSSLAFFCAATLCAAAPHKAKRPALPQSKGQKQIAGGDGEFGTVYSLKDTFNFEVLSARYTVEPIPAHETRMAGTDKKLVVVDVAIKNAGSSDNNFNSDAYVTLVDAQGALYTNSVLDLVLASRDNSGDNLTLRPGQGVGQPERHDPLRFVLAVPAKARIVKIMVNQGRLNSSEKVLRYFVAGATEAEAGKDGDPRNVIAPLPDDVRDPADPSGATALDSGKGTAGVFLPSGGFALRLDSLRYTSDPTPERGPPADGMKYALVTLTVRNLTPTPQTMLDVTGGDSSPCTLTDSGGETDKCVGFLKAKSDEAPEHDFKPGGEYTFRVVIPLATSATAKTLTLGMGLSRTWTFAVTAALEGPGGTG